MCLTVLLESGSSQEVHSLLFLKGGRWQWGEQRAGNLRVAALGRKARGETGRRVQEESSDASLLSVGILGNILLK